MDSELFNLTGKTALVTGGSRGIGLAIAKEMARNEGNVAIIARDEKQLDVARQEIQSETGKKAWTFAFDLAETKDIERLFEKIVRETAGIDILVNCAGMSYRAPAEDIKLEGWNRVFDVNLTAVLVMSQAFCRHCRQAEKAGKIVNIGSLMCHGARPTTAAYASSKGALLMLTKSLAVEWAKHNINVNTIGPGYIATDLTTELQADEEFDKWVLSKTPFGRWGQPGDVAGAAVFLACDASNFVTGQILYVDGGWLAAL